MRVYVSSQSIGLRGERIAEKQRMGLDCPYQNPKLLTEETGSFMTKYNKYAYLIDNAWMVKLFYALGIVTWLLTTYGFFRFFNLSPFYWVFIAPIFLVFTAYHLISYGINLFYEGFDLSKHRAKVFSFWEKGAEPMVDILLPVCGEPISILQKTFEGVNGIEYENKNVYVLDDRDEKDVKELAESYGFTYSVRPNRGHMKKAGNLKYGFENSSGEYIVIFDADFVPNKDFIKELLPYMDDPKMGIIQSPQYFETTDNVHERSPIEFGAGHVQEDFYRIIQSSRDTFGGAICVGSNAIYRRSALEKIGGTVQIEHSEDVHTGFRLVEKGYKIKYIPLILAIGLCPQDLHSYFHQQHRWCSGSMSLLFMKEFWTSPLTLAQKLCYISGFLYYITHGLALVFSFQIFFLLFFHYEWISLWNALPFFPYIVYSFFLMPLFRITKARSGTVLVRQAHNFHYGQALARKMMDSPIEWKATGSVGSISSEYTKVLHLKGMYLIVYMALVSIVIGMGHIHLFNIQYYSVLFWIFYTLGVNGLLLWHSFKAVDAVLDAEGAGTAYRTDWMVQNAIPYVAGLVIFPVTGMLVNFLR